MSQMRAMNWHEETFDREPFFAALDNVEFVGCRFNNGFMPSESDRVTLDGCRVEGLVSFKKCNPKRLFINSCVFDSMPVLPDGYILNDFGPGNIVENASDEPEPDAGGPLTDQAEEVLEALRDFTEQLDTGFADKARRIRMTFQDSLEDKGGLRATDRLALAISKWIQGNKRIYESEG